MGKRVLLLEFMLHVINLVFTVWGLGTLCYGLVCFFKWKQSLSKEIHEDNVNAKYIIVHRLLLAIDEDFSDTLPKAWFIYLIIGIGAFLLIVSCLGFAGTASKSPCCLLSYFAFLVALIIVELATAAFIFFRHNWKEVIPKDRSGIFHTVYHFVNANWKVIRWLALGVFILQVIATILSVFLRAVFIHAWYDTSDEEGIVHLQHASVRPKTYNYRVLAPIGTTTADNARDPAKQSPLN